MLQEFRAFMVVAANPRGRRTELLISFYCVSSHVPSYRATLRHTFSTHQIHNGLKINQLKEVLGHRRMETTYKYVHLDRTNLRQEMEQGAL
jgi:site-specific recombinase XerC